jgi:hypothetical protein
MAIHEGPSSLDRRAGVALMRAGRQQREGFEHFWKRDDAAFGELRWAGEGSKAIDSAPPGLLQATAEAIGALNGPSTHGRPVGVTVTFFSWRRGSLGGPVTIGVECVGRGLDGQILWMGADHFQIRPDPAGAQEVARAAAELTRRLGVDLAREKTRP